MSSIASSSGNDEAGNIAYKLVAATIIGMLLPTIAVALRMMARKIQCLPLYLDDWLMVIAWLFKLGLDISGAVLIEHGMGRHIVTVSANDLVVFLQVQYTGAIQYPLCVTFTKLSILYQYRRLFPTRDFRWMTNVLIVVIILWCTSVVFCGVFICTPISKAWSPAEPGTCINYISFYYGLQIPNVVTDALVLILPLREVQKLDLPLKQKLGVGLTCALWVVSLIFGIVRLVVLINLNDNDPTYDLVDAAIWTTIEPAVAISTACLPSLRVLYRSARNNTRHRKSVSQRLHSLSLASAVTGDTEGRSRAESQSKGGVTGYGLQSLQSTEEHDRKRLGNDAV